MTDAMSATTPPKTLRKLSRKLLDRYRITDGKHFRMADHDTADTGGKLVDHEHGPDLLAAGVQRLAELQELLYPQNSWSLLCVFQAMDSGGKDGTIKHVMSGVNPQGVQVTSFKVPGPEDLSHDFLWRVSQALPQRGHIGIFNRAHYEEVLVTRVHPEVLAKQNLPAGVQGKHFWKHRLEDIAQFEHYLTRQGTIVLKFFLHISKEEQKKRFLARLDHPEKNWKFSAADLAERGYWDAYMDAYEKAIAATATPYAPWFVVPADHKWFARLVVVEAMIEALEDLKLKPPELSQGEKDRLAEARRQLENEPG
jgi:PPK2 family polyphosphate:nucleotide phosphotransferase